MIRKILLPLRGEATDRARLETGFALARRFEALLEGFFVRPEPSEMLPYLGEGVSAAAIQDIVDTARQAADQQLQAARTAMGELSASTGVNFTSERRPALPAARLTEEVGPYPECVARRARLSDLVLFAQPDPDEGPDQGTALNECLMSSGRPVMLLPRDHPHTTWERAVIGWDGSAEAAEAVFAAMPFLRKMARVEVLNVSKNPIKSRVADDLTDYLHLHDVEGIERLADPGNRAVGEVILSEARAAKADLLVMGGYGHSRLRELILGGVTRHILGNADLPVLLAH